MKIKLSDLRRIIREEVERNMLWTAGMVGGNLNQPRKGINYMPLPGLGASTEKTEKTDDINTGEYEEEESGIDTN